jgi:hypothetical protein
MICIINTGIETIGEPHLNLNDVPMRQLVACFFQMIIMFKIRRWFKSTEVIRGLQTLMILTTKLSNKYTI